MVPRWPWLPSLIVMVAAVGLAGRFSIFSKKFKEQKSDTTIKEVSLLYLRLIRERFTKLGAQN